jgi:cobalt/nickel transport system permease protein
VLGVQTMTELLRQTLAHNMVAGSGRVQEIDARSRVIGALLFACAVVAVESYVALIVALAFALGVAVIARLPLAATLKRVLAMDLFVVMMLLMLPFTTPGEPAFTLHGYAASWDGLHRAIGIGLKANAVLLFLLATVGTLESVQLGHALHRLGCPAPLVHMLMFTVRYVDVLHIEFLRLTTAMKARGFRAGNNRHTYRTYGYLVGMLIVRAMERSERILAAMKCRGFSGKIHLLSERRFGMKDGCFAAVLAIVIAALFGLE